MKLLPTLGVVAVLAVGVVLFLRSRVAPNYVVRPSDTGRVLAQLINATREPAFAVFMFTTPDRPASEDSLNLQLSLENGTPGMDWVLLGRRNVEDADRVRALASALGFSPTEQEGNGVRYLRVEGGDIGKLTESVMTQLYGIPRGAQVDLITEGFEWRP